MTKDARMVIDYLQNKKTKEEMEFDPCMIEILDEIKDKFCAIFCAKDSILEGNQLTLNKFGVELLQNYFNDRVGEHAVIIKDNQVIIGCKTFSFAFLKELIRLYRKDIRSNDVWVRYEYISILCEIKGFGITITDEGFECEGFEVSVETVEGWIK